jgi:urate oxidase
MRFSIVQNNYGKSRIRMTKVRREGEVQDVIELSIDIRLEGNFADAYTSGDNQQLIPTDTMKNTVYALARQHELQGAESFACILARHFVERFAHVSTASVDIVEHPWQRATVNGNPHPHVFLGSSTERHTCSAYALRNASDTVDCLVRSGIDGLMIMKTTQSGFSGFLRDEYTTLAETEDRILATTVEAQWLYRFSPDSYRSLRERIRASLIEAFAERFSPSVQFTMRAMAAAVLESESGVATIRLTMPNQHRLLVNLEPFGLDNPNAVFVPTDEPFGNITAEFARDATGEAPDS